MTPKASVLVVQLLYHPFDESLKSVLNMDFTDLRVDIIYLLFDTREGSNLCGGKEYFETIVPDASSQHWDNRLNAQREKTRYARDLTLKNGYDYMLYCADDAVCEPDALQKLLAVEKDFVSGLTGPIQWDGNPKAFSGRVYDPEGPQDADDRQIELHKDYEFGDVIEITNAAVCFALISRKILEHPEFDGYYERSIWRWLEQHGFKAYLHTGVRIKYLGFQEFGF